MISDPNLINNGKKPTSSALTGDIVEVIILTIVYCALWVLMARMNRSGRVWARIVASVLFAISTISLYSAVNSLHGGETILVVNIISFVLEVAEWVMRLRRDRPAVAVGVERVLQGALGAALGFR